MNCSNDHEATKAGSDYYDRAEELKAFDDTKAGVKGLVDAGIVKVPRMFIRPPEVLAKELNYSPEFPLRVPVIDLEGQGIQVVEKVLDASEKWGFFQVVNHGIPLSLLNEMILGGRKFHEQEDVDAKKALYSRDGTKKVRLFSNSDLYMSKSAYWRDTLLVSDDPATLDPQELPAVCRDVMIEYSKHMRKLGEILLELLSKALGLKPDYLKEMGCLGKQALSCNYYPRCPEPHLTLGIDNHQDPVFLTVLLQDQIGGLQVLHQDHWVDVHPTLGALIVNIGDLLQIVSNDKFKSVTHRVVSNDTGPRISVPTFFNGSFTSPKQYGPIKEILSEKNPPLYRDFQISEYLSLFFSRPLDCNSCISGLKIHQ